MIDRRTFVAASGALLLPAALWAGEEPLRMRDLYNKDRSFSDLAQALEDTPVTVRGYMAPPLKAETRFYVLTKLPMSVCPFCESEADWPEDILAVYAKRVVDVLPITVAISASGRLRLGRFQDPETGFVSRVRLEEAATDRI